MSRRGLNKPIVTDGVQIVSGIMDSSGNGGSSMTTPGEKNGVNGELVHVNNTIAADWVGTRYFAVDYDGGSDENVGYSDVDMATAGTVPLKTFEELVTRLPKSGQGQIAVVAVKLRAGGATYLKKDGVTPDTLTLNGISGYFTLLVRGTGTNATANSVAFANDTADKIYLGAQIVTGTNAAGYNPVAPITVNNFNVQLNGGGAPGLAAEPGLIGKRIRFSSTTTTVALRNATAMIHANAAANITASDDFPAVPVAADVFYVEEPGVAFDSIFASSSTTGNTIGIDFRNRGINIAGFRTVNTGGGMGGMISGTASFNYSFIDSLSVSVSGATSFFFSDCTDVRVGRNYFDETGTLIVSGVGVRSFGILTIARASFSSVTSSALVGTTLGRVQVLDVLSAKCGAGSYFYCGVLYQGVGIGVSGNGTIVGNLIGRGNSTTERRLRVLNAIASPIAGVSIATCDCDVFGVDITGMATSPLMVVRGVGQNFAINDVVGSIGNTGVGLDLTLAQSCRISMGTIIANTFTAAANKDILGNGSVFYVHADYVRCDLKDDDGNSIQGTGGTIIGTTVIVANDGNADIGQYKIVRPTGSGLVRASIATAPSTAIVVGITQSAPTTVQNTILVNGGGTWIQFDAAPTTGDIAYLSTTNAGNAQNTKPVGTGTNVRVMIGRVLKVSGTLGYVNFNPNTLPVIDSPYALFKQTADKTIASTNVETTLIGTGLGSVTIPANSLAVGDMISVEMRGYFSRTVGTITFRSKLGGTTQASSAITPSTSTNGLFIISIMITIRSIGAGGTAIAQGYVQNYASASPQAATTNAFTPQTATFAINTTADQAYDLTSQWSTSSAGNAITSTNFILIQE